MSAMSEVLAERNGLQRVFSLALNFFYFREGGDKLKQGKYQRHLGGVPVGCSFCESASWSCTWETPTQRRWEVRPVVRTGRDQEHLVPQRRWDWGAESAWEAWNPEAEPCLCVCVCVPMHVRVPLSVGAECCSHRRGQKAPPSPSGHSGSEQSVLAKSGRTGSGKRVLRPQATRCHRPVPPLWGLTF